MPRATGGSAVTFNHDQTRKYIWSVHYCSTCGKAVVKGQHVRDGLPIETLGPWPAPKALSEDIEPRPRELLRQAIESLNQPDGAVMLAASAVDAMLRARELRDGSLYQRIDAARDNHLITPEAAEWAHAVRLDANEVRHADEQSVPHDHESARRAVQFAEALAEFLFVLPALVRRGRSEAKASPPLPPVGKAPVPITPVR
jgi:hypothetical protein